MTATPPYIPEQEWPQHTVQAFHQLAGHLLTRFHSTCQGVAEPVLELRGTTTEGKRHTNVQAMRTRSASFSMAGATEETTQKNVFHYRTRMLFTTRET